MTAVSPPPESGSDWDWNWKGAGSHVEDLSVHGYLLLHFRSHSMMCRSCYACSQGPDGDSLQSKVYQDEIRIAVSD